MDGGWSVGATRRSWPEAAARIPAWVYSDPEIYRLELERIFYGPHWSYLALECELPGPGAFRTTKVGERSVIVARQDDGSIAAFENRCAHRGARFCQSRGGVAKEFVCPYHQWVYGRDGALQGVPFRRGVKGKGGMPRDFDPAQHGLRRLKVEAVNGVVWGTFDDATPPFRAYLGDAMWVHYTRVYDGRPLKLLGWNRQRIPGNWKLMMENIKDPYHPGLLHVFFATFGLFRADQQSSNHMDPEGRHGILLSRKGEQAANEVSASIRTFQSDLTLHDPSILDYEHEWPGPETVGMMTIFPSVILQQQVNSLSTRQIQPLGPHAFDFVWTHWAYADEPEEMTRRRLRQANLFGPAGLVSAEDGEVIAFSQEALAAADNAECVVAMGGTEIGDTDYMVSETLIRGMYAYWRRVMGI